MLFILFYSVLGVLCPQVWQFKVPDRHSDTAGVKISAVNSLSKANIKGINRSLWESLARHMKMLLHILTGTSGEAAGPVSQRKSGTSQSQLCWTSTLTQQSLCADIARSFSPTLPSCTCMQTIKAGAEKLYRSR